MRKPPERQALRMAFADTLRTLRKKTGIAQEVLAYDAGIDRAYMGGLERGEHTPSLEVIYRLLPVLHVSFRQFAVELEHTLKRNKMEGGGK